ncbi:histidinol-phosphatase [Aurantibacter sp.]|uniref:PHP domain-containing protein n=1 Tax=Aurantibacter sp. TaxID=2807103 RepID=UPI003265E157
MKSVQILMLFLFIVVFSCKDQNSKTEQSSSKKWYKGNLHTHSYWSDGDEFPEVILDWYKERDYNFMALSDHNTIANGEKWITIKNDSMYQTAFKNYLKKYGEEWVDYKIDSNRTKVKLKTYDEYRNLTEETGEFLVIKSEEITDKFEDKHIHMNATNIQNLIDPIGGTSVLNVLQNNINQVLEQREKTGVPIMPHVNHPNFFYSVSLNDMIQLKGERFFEVYNGHPMVHNMGDSVNVSTEEMWDLINISYLESNKPLMYGLATDDSHSYHQKGTKWSNAGRGWVMVQADTLSANALINSLENGDFYATTGVNLDAIEVKNGTYSVSVLDEPGIFYKITFLGSKKENTNPVEFKTVEGTSASFKLTDDILFVRCKITSTKLQDNPIEELLYEMAWTQPVTVTE